MQARYYDPVIGRFYSNDPVGFRDIHSFNRYAYANNNPYKFIDPNGMWSAKAHDKLLSNALGSRINKADLKVIQQSSRAFDKRTQAANQSHMHSMISRWVDKKTRPIRSDSVKSELGEKKVIKGSDKAEMTDFFLPEYV
jgi:uncharacterized protein RhaS with RHS repeats